MALVAPRYSVELFTRTGNVLVTEASDLQFSGPRRLWDDACDEGIVLVERFGKEIPFVLTDREKDKEGDLVAWQFAEYRGQRKITIFND